MRVRYNSRRLRYLPPAAVATVLGLSSTAGWAQDAAEPLVLPTVNVTASAERGYSPVQGFVAGVSAAGTKTDTPIIETPQSISVVTADEIKTRNARNLNQALRYTAGAATETRGSTAVRLDQLTLRGYQPATYLDGMRTAGGRDANSSIDAYRLERLEVLRGPASVLYGAAPPGGLVNAVTKRPTEQRIREVLLEAGSRDRYRAAGDISGKLDEDGQWLGRFIGSYSEGDGELDQTRERRYFFSPSLTWRPTTDTSVTFVAHYQRDPESGSYGGIPAYGSVLFNPRGRIANRFYDGDPDLERSNREHYYVGYFAEHRVNDWLQLRQNARYLHTQGEYRSVYTASLTPDSTSINRSVFGTDSDYDVFTLDNQAQINVSTGPLQHTVLAGLDYYRVLGDVYTGSVIGGAGASRQNLFRPAYASQRTTFPPFSTYASQRQNQIGTYLQDQIKLDRLVLLAGGRFDWSDSSTEGSSPATGRRTSRTDSSDSAFTARAGAVYLFDNGLAPYVSYTESFEPQGGTDRLGNPFDPTRGRQYEAGLRYQPPGTNVSLSAAVFDLVRQNVLTTDPVNSRFSVQSGETTSRGIELEAKASLMQGLNMTAAYAYQNVEFSRSNNTSRVDYGIQGAAAGPTVRLEGKTPWSVPRHTASAWLDYSFAENTSLQGLGIGGGVRYLGSSFGNDANTFRVASATLFDATLRYDLGKLGRNLEGTQFALNVTNLADTRYVSSCFAYSSCWYGYGRVVTGTVRYNF